MFTIYQTVTNIGAVGISSYIVGTYSLHKYNYLNLIAFFIYTTIIYSLSSIYKIRQFIRLYCRKKNNYELHENRHHSNTPNTTLNIIYIVFMYTNWILGTTYWALFRNDIYSQYKNDNVDSLIICLNIIGIYNLVNLSFAMLLIVYVVYILQNQYTISSNNDKSEDLDTASISTQDTYINDTNHERDFSRLSPISENSEPLEYPNCIKIENIDKFTQTENTTENINEKTHLLNDSNSVLINNKGRNEVGNEGGDKDEIVEHTRRKIITHCLV